MEMEHHQKQTNNTKWAVQNQSDFDWKNGKTERSESNTHQNDQQNVNAVKE